MKQINEQDIKNITINYDDGTKEVVTKGIACNLENLNNLTSESDTANITVAMTNIAGNELKHVVYTFMELGFKLGFFDNELKENKK